MKKLLFGLMLLVMSFGVMADCFYIPVYVDEMPISLATVCQQAYVVNDTILSTIKIHSLQYLHINKISVGDFPIVDPGANKFLMMDKLEYATTRKMNEMSKIYIVTF